MNLWTTMNPFTLGLLVFVITGDNLVQPCRGRRLSASNYPRLTTTTATYSDRILGVHGGNSPNVSYDGFASGEGDSSTTSSGEGGGPGWSTDGDDYGYDDDDSYDDDYYNTYDDYPVPTFPPTYDEPTTFPPTKSDDGVVPTLPPTMDDKNDDNDYDDDYPATTPPVEEIVEPSGSNDGTFLERICV